MSTRWERIARSTMGDDYAARYAERFREIAASGGDPHGEATFAAGLVAPPARVLDAGCGTGRVAVRLHELGYEVVGVDVDLDMLFEASAETSGPQWLLDDLATMDLGETFDLVLVAGNTIPLLEPNTLTTVCERLAAHAVPGGLVACGFGLDEAHLPGDCPPTPLSDFEAAMTDAGLVEIERFGTWDHNPFDPAGGYVVSVHRRPA